MNKVEILAAEMIANDDGPSALFAPLPLPVLRGWAKHQFNEDPATDEEWAGWLLREAYVAVDKERYL